MESKLHFLKYPGSMLSDRDIRLAIDSGYIQIESPTELCIQPASVDVHLASTIAFISRGRLKNSAIDLKKPVEDFMEYAEIDPIEGLALHPREFILGVTRESFSFPDQLAGNLDGKSSLGRLGLIVHSTAGFFDPGFCGHGTLEITNLTERPLIIYPDMPIGQMRFSVLSSPSERVYGDKSLGSKQYKNPYSLNPGPKSSEYYKNFLTLVK